MYSLAIFDLDGTLLDTLDDLYNAVNFALREFAFPLRSKDEVRHFIGHGVKKLIERATPDGTSCEVNEACLQVFREYYLSHMRDCTIPFDGVTALLSALREKNIKTAVVSNKLHEAVRELCEDYFPGLIDVAIGVSCEEERKPNPINVLKALDYFGENSSTAIYIGDSEVDVQTAHNASLECIGVTWGFRTKEGLLCADCEFTADSTKEVFQLICK